MKILILEDDQNDVEMILRELTKSGLSYTSEVVDSREAYESAIENYIPDLILSDYSLPSFDGASAFQIRQNKCPETPFIIVSGIIGEENAVDLIKSGVTDYALKDKLFSLAPKITRAIKDVELKSEKKIADEKLEAQYKNLLEIALMQSHQVRVPITHIIGLFNLFQFDNPNDPINAEILGKLKIVAHSLDKIIHMIMKKTTDIRNTTR